MNKYVYGCKTANATVLLKVPSCEKRFLYADTSLHSYSMVK